MKKNLLFSSLLFYSVIFAFGQSATELEMLGLPEREAMAHEAIHSIYEGVLVVRLASNARKAKVLKEQIKDPYSSFEQRKMCREMLEKSSAETRENNELLMASFSKHYDFSEVFFVYDTSLHYLTSGHEKGIFLSQELTIDSTINLAGRPYRLARYGSPLAAGLQEMLGIVVMDHLSQDLPPPFPYKSIGIRSAILNSEKRKPRLLRHFKSIIERLNKNFHQYYRECKAMGSLPD